MTYTVLARKYRPQSFADMVGQEHVSRTLGNALRSDRVAHAFLFTGARGVGKTTTARLLAKALNCEQGPTPEPCNQCDPCVEITAGNDLDVLEIDGASNNSVDDVRRLQESLPYRPARDRFKVVIVDEVHMLSAGAFNAFLKTLEEPPPHVKFIFATTESHKVPITIRSRCQRHDFRLIPHAVVAQAVRSILEKEGVEADDAAVAIVSREAAGSMRDALTVLDQLLAFGGTSLKGVEVAQGLGIAGRDSVLGVAAALLKADPRPCLTTIVTLGEQGLDMLHFARQLLELMRDLVVLKVVGDDRELVELVEEERARAREIVDAHSAQELERAFAGLSRLVDEVGHSGSPQLTLEMGLVRLADRAPLQPLGELLAEVKQLGERLGTGGPTPDRGRGGGGGGGAAGPGPGRRGGGGPGGSRGARSASAGAAPPAQPRPAAPDAVAPRGSGPPGGASTAPAPTTAATSADASKPEAATGAPPPAVRKTLEAPPGPTPSAPPRQASRPRQSEGAPKDKPSSRAGASIARPTPAPAKVAAAPHDTAESALLPGVSAEWQAIVADLTHGQPALAAVLQHGVPVTVTPEALRVSFPEGSFFGKQASAKSARDSIVEAAQRVLGQRPELTITFGEEAQGPTVAAAEAALRNERREQTVEAALSHPRVREAMEVFPESEGNVDVHVEME